MKHGETKNEALFCTGVCICRLRLCASCASGAPERYADAFFDAARAYFKGALYKTAEAEFERSDPTRRRYTFVPYRMTAAVSMDGGTDMEETVEIRRGSTVLYRESRVRRFRADGSRMRLPARDKKCIFSKKRQKSLAKG